MNDATKTTLIEQRTTSQSAGSIIKKFAWCALEAGKVALPFLFAASLPIAEGAETTNHAIVHSPPEDSALVMMGSVAVVAFSTLSTLALFGAALHLGREQNPLQRMALSDCSGILELEKEMFRSAEAEGRSHQEKVSRCKLLPRFDAIEKRFSLIARQIPFLGPKHPLQEELQQLKQEFSLSQFSRIKKKKAQDALDDLEKEIESLEDKFQDALSAIPPPKHLTHLIETPSHPIDDKLFQHILGDYWGKNTGLEGYNSERMIRYFCQFLEQEIESSGDESLLSLQREFEEAAELSASFLRSPSETFRDELKAALAKKNPGESVFFMNGWQNKMGGHATVFRMTLGENGLYTVRIFNRGAGMSYHAENILSGKQQAIPFLEVREVKGEQFDEIIIQALQEMESPPSSGEGWGASDLYRGILPFLGKVEVKEPSLDTADSCTSPLVEFERKSDDYPSEKEMEHLKVGHCTYLALTGVLHESIPDSYERFIFDLQLKTLLTFFEQNQSELARNPQKRTLLFKGAQQLSRNGEKAFGEMQILTLKEFHLVNELLAVIFHVIEESEQEASLQKLYDESPWQGIKDIPYTPTEQGFDEPQALSSASAMQVDPSSFNPSQSQFSEQCQEWQGHFAKANQQALYPQSKELIQDWVRKIPLSWLDASADWKSKISSEEAAAILKTLSLISEELLWAQLNLAEQMNRDKTQDPENLFAIIKLLSIADAIAKEFKDSTGAHLQGLYQLNFDLLFEQSGSILLFDPELDEQVHRLKIYWDQADPIEERQEREHLSFFGVEATPLLRGDRLHYEEASKDCGKETFEWAYLSWIKKYLQTREGVEKIEAQFPEFAQKSLLVQAVTVLGKKDFLPTGYEALSTLSWVSNALFQPFRNLGEKFQRNRGIETVVSDKYLSLCEVTGYEERQYLFGQTNTDWLAWLSGAYITSDTSKPRGNHPASIQIDSNYFVENGQDLPESLLSIYGTNHTTPHFLGKTESLVRKRLGPYLRHEISLESKLGMNNEQMQDLLALSAIRELQVVETLAYFSNHLEILLQRDYQILFRNLIAQPPLLHEQLLRDPSFAAKLASFARKGYEINQQVLNSQAAEFFLDLNRYFTASVRGAGLSVEEAGFFDTRQELLRLIEKHRGNPVEQSPYQLDIAALLDPALLDDQGAIDLLSAYAHLKLYPIPENHPSYYKSEILRLQDHLSRFQGVLAKLLSGPSRDKILNAVLQSAFPGSSSFQWRQLYGDSPFFHTQSFEAESFSINTASASVYRGFIELVPVPKEILEYKLLKPIFEKEQILIVESPAPGIYQWTLANGLKIRAKQGYKVKIQREIEAGLWAEYSDENPRNEKINDLEREALLARGFSAEDIDQFFDKLASEKIPNGLLWPNNAVLKEHQKVTENQRTWIADASGTILYSLTYTQTDELYTPSIARLLPSGEEWVLHLPTKDCPFGRLEEEGFALLWQNKEGKMVSVELPRYNLAFIDQGQGLQAKELPGFVLQNESLELPFPMNPLIVEKKGKRRILFLNPTYQTSKIFQESGRSFFQYEKAKKGLRPIANEDRLFLCFIELLGEQYDKAAALFIPDKSQLKAYSDEEKAILRMIIDPSAIDFKDKNFSPSSVAIRLRALYMLQRNKMDFQGENEELDEEKIQTLLWLYVQHHREVPIRFRLSLDEEKWLLKSFKLNQPLLEQRKKVLFNEPLEIPSFGNNPTELQEWDSVRTALFANRHWQSAKIEPNTINRSLLRKTGLPAQFKDLFKILLTPRELTQLRKAYQTLLGKKPQDSLTREELFAKIEKAFSLIAVSRTDPNERAAAIILLAVLRNPEDENLKNYISGGYYSYEHDSFKHFVMATKETLESLSFPKSSIEEGSLLPLDPEPLRIKPCSSFQHPQFIPFNLSLPEGMLAKEETLGQTVPAELSDLFDVASEDPAISSHLSSLRGRLQNYSSEPKRQFHLQNKEMLIAWKEEISNSSVKLRSELGDEEAKLLALANKNYLHPIDHELRLARLKSGSEDLISMEELLLLPAYADSTLLVQRNPALRCEEAEAILQKIHLFLLMATHLQRLERVLKSISLMESLKSPEEISLAFEEISRIAESERVYDVKEHPEYLVFEFHMNLLLWPEQGLNLEKLRHNGVALEMIMGGGKTSVLTPLLLFKCADGNTLCTLIMPESLIPSMSEALKSTLWKSFAKTIELVEINRATPLKEENLERLYSRLENAIVERKVVVMSASSLQSLLLRFVEALDQERKKSEESSSLLSSVTNALFGSETSSEPKLYQKIFKLMREKGLLQMDELDLLVDVLKAHHFSRGKKEKMHEDRLAAVSHLYRLLLTDPELKDTIRWNFLPDRGGKNPLTKESYANFQPLLIEKILSAELAFENESKSFFAHLTLYEKNLLRAYLKKEKNSEAERFVANIPSKRVKNFLADWKEEIGTLLPLTAAAEVDENYGENPTVESPMAIPFHGIEVPAPQSLHGLDLEILNYTIQMCLAKGIKLAIVQEEINRLQNIIQAELSKQKIYRIEESPHYGEFAQLTGGKKDYNLFNLNSYQLEEILERVNRDPELKLKLVVRHQLPSILRFTQELHTNNHAASLLFRRKIGFSGTFWNADSYPSAFLFKDLSNTEVRTLQLLWTQETPVSILNTQPSLQKKIETLYAVHRGSLADRGGILRDSDGEAVARAIFSLPIWKKSKIKGIAYYDAEEKQKILLKETMQIVSFEESELSKEEIIAYWSQKYTTGSDVPLAANMKTIVTVSKSTTMRDFLQTVWRNRQLHRGQTISIVVPEEDALVIRETLKEIGESVEGDIALKHVLLYAKYIEAAKQGNYNLRALRFNLENVLLDSFFDKLFEAKAPLSLIEEIEQYFFKAKPEEPHDENGALEELVSGEKIAEIEIERLRASIDYQRRSRSEKAQIESAWGKIVKESLEHLPKLSSRRMNTGAEVEMEQEAENQNETEMELEKVKEIENSREIEPKALYVWKEENLFSSAYFTPSRRQKVPAELLTIPDFERIDPPIHPLDHLQVFGEDPLAKIGIRPLQRLEMGTDLLISLNANPSHKTKELLLIRDKTNGQIQVLVLNQWDALMFQRLLEKDRLEPIQGKRDIQIALYHMYLGLIGQGSDPIDANIEQNPDFLRLKLQADFLNGKSDYTASELKMLKTWIEKEGVKKMEELFTQTILKNKPSSASNYRSSPLAKLFESL